MLDVSFKDSSHGSVDSLQSFSGLVSHHVQLLPSAFNARTVTVSFDYLLVNEVAAISGDAEASEQEGVNGLSKELCLSLFTIPVHRIAHEVEALNRILEVSIVLVVTVREDKQLKVLQELALGLVVR